MAITKRNLALVSTVCLGLLAILLVLSSHSQETSVHENYRTEYSYSDNDVKSELLAVGHNVRKCFNSSGLGSSDSNLLQLGIDNAQLFMKEYRKVIPRKSLEHHASHCWQTDYSASTTALSWYTGRVTGRIAGQKFDRPTDSTFYGKSEYRELSSRFNGKFSSNTVCLPKAYLLGFEKCGSTYLWCFISKVINAFSENSGKSSDKYHADKEPYFWTPFLYAKSLPHSDTIGNPYLLNFLQASDPKITTEERKQILLIDGTPSTVIEWPKFRESDPDLANYCLLPSALPQLFPNSKYVVIMRDPVDMLYSNFWWTYYVDALISYSLIKDVLNAVEGPKIFHDHSVSKINFFLQCLREESQEPCPFVNATPENYSSCISSRTHLLSKCVNEITTNRKRKESAIHRGIYYVHVRKWLSVLPRDRILFVTLETLKKEPAKIASQVLDLFEINGERNKLPLTDKVVKNITSDCSTNSKGLIDYKHSPDIKNMLKETEVLLKKFFVPFNKLLAELLESDQFLWNS